ncbi:putative sugar transporter [Aspergillus parasiticus]|uniref:Putative sugar transporter n=1 Tax=Aspergillus parasiticus TaxID=5067 RepID=A0A5N6DQE9_ASPPA|nr:putative sugar transporter [Aspergillus parasiticus]
MGTAGGGISKAALSRVPRQARSSFIWLAAIWASYCGSLHGFNTSNISGAMGMSTFKETFGWDDLSSATVSNYKGWITSSMLLGQTAGILLSGPLMERSGRKIVILIAAITYTIGSLLMAANFGSLAQFLAGRVVSGLGSGIAYSAGPVYLSEIAPAELRGMLSTFYNAGIMSGVAGAYWINYGSSQVFPNDSQYQWRVSMILQLIPSTALLIGYPFFPESPRFLMMAGQQDAAKHSLSRLRGGLDETNEYFLCEWNDLVQSVESHSGATWSAFINLLRKCVHEKPIRKIILFVLLLQTFFIMSGGNSITYYAPNILNSVGFDAEKVLLFTAVYGTIKFISVFLYSFFLTERFGRRPLLLAGASINLACLIYISAYLGKAGSTNSANSPSAAAIVAVIAICIFAIGYGFGWGPSFSLAASEICPTSIRGSVVTLGFTYQNLLNFGITRGFPNMTEAMSPWGPFALFAACTFCGIIWVFLAFPECKGRSMESTETLFVLPWYKIGFVPVVNPRDDNDVDMEKDIETQHREFVSGPR